MNKFDQVYFDKHYSSQFDKNPKSKIKFYLKTLIDIQEVDLKNRESKLLDIGCGYGIFLSQAEKYFRTYGIDVSEFVINKAKKVAVNTIFYTGDFLEIKFDKKFDLITAFDVLEHIPDLRKALDKINLLLTDKGIFMCVIPVYDGLFGRIGRLLDRDVTHIQKLGRKIWEKMLFDKFLIIKKMGLIRFSIFPTWYLHIASAKLNDQSQALMIIARKK